GPSTRSTGLRTMKPHRTACRSAVRNTARAYLVVAGFFPASIIRFWKAWMAAGVSSLPNRVDRHPLALRQGDVRPNGDLRRTGAGHDPREDEGRTGCGQVHGAEGRAAGQANW